LIATAVQHAPAADIRAMDRMFQSMSNPLYLPACKRARTQFELKHDAFQDATGSDCAIVMAGHGHPGCTFRETDGTRQSAAVIGAAQR
jgi:hypothetical protein